MGKRRKTKTVKIGPVGVGSKFPISIQSMAKTDTGDAGATIRQIKALEKEGCEIIRVAVKNSDSITSLTKIKRGINIPLVADIHFNYRLGLEAIAAGIDALRLNPGNIYRKEEVTQIAKAAKRKKIPIRVGVNSGSLRQSQRVRVSKSQRASTDSSKRLADSMVKSALNYIRMLESMRFYDIIVSLKASDVATTVDAYRKMAALCNYPFHLGITASGLTQEGTIKSAIGMGSLLLEGIGDTIRVSLTATPQEEVRAAKQILQSLRLREFGPEIVACPTCGRTQADVIKIVRKVKDQLSAISYQLSAKKPLKIAIMGCEVNGPGEAREANIGIACGKNSAVLFKRGKIVKRIKEREIVETLITELEKKHALV